MSYKNALSLVAEHDAEVLDIYTSAHARSASAYLMAPKRTMPEAFARYTSNAVDMKELAERMALAATVLTAAHGVVL